MTMLTYTYLSSTSCWDLTCKRNILLKWKYFLINIIFLIYILLSLKPQIGVETNYINFKILFRFYLTKTINFTWNILKLLLNLCNFSSNNIMLAIHLCNRKPFLCLLLFTYSYFQSQETFVDGSG